MRSNVFATTAALMMMLATTHTVFADLVILGQFGGVGSPVGCAFDHTTNTVWVYTSFGASISSYTPAGEFIGSVPRPGEAANDVDLEFAPEVLTLGKTQIPAGTLLFINGETGVAEIYAVDKTTGQVIASLTTAFGVSHVVGGAYHPGRNTFFLVQDKVPGGVNANRVAEINPLNGAVLNTFQTTGVFSVNFGDLEINAATGNIFLASSDEARLGEFTPSGVLVQSHALPTGVTSLCGIGMDDAGGKAWVSGTGGTIWRLGGLPAQCGVADINCDGVVNVNDLLAVINGWGTCPPPCPPTCPADVNGDCAVNVNDLLLVINNWG